MLNSIAIFFLGAVFGSFLNVVILRLPRQEQLGGRSHCPHCGAALGAWDLVPLLSFLFLKGRCRHCGQKISPRYFIIELVCGLLFLFCWLYLRPGNAGGYLLLAKDCFIAAVLLAVFAIDLEHYLILDSVVFPSMLAVALFNLGQSLFAHQGIFSLGGFFISGLIAGLAAALPFFLLWYFSGGNWMGFGDVKLAGFLGLALGWPVVWVGLFAAIMAGGLTAVFLLALGKKTLKSQIPFGTFLSLGALLAMFYGDRLLHWYLAVIGI